MSSPLQKQCTIMYTGHTRTWPDLGRHYKATKQSVLAIPGVSKINILGFSEIWGNHKIKACMDTCNFLTKIRPSTPLVTPGRAPMRVAFPVCVQNNIKY